MLDRANFEQRVTDLQTMINAQVGLIDAVARFDHEHSGSEVSGGSLAATKGQIIDRIDHEHRVSVTVFFSRSDPIVTENASCSVLTTCGDMYS